MMIIIKQGSHNKGIFCPLKLHVLNFFTWVYCYIASRFINTNNKHNRSWSKYLSISLFLSSSVSFAQLPDIKEGLWRVNTETLIPGMPVKMPAMSIERCFTQKDMNPEKILQQNNCQIKHMDIQNNLAQWSMSCQQDGLSMQGSGSIQYQQTSFLGTFDMTMSGASQGGMTLHTKLTGHYVGKCP